MPETFDPSRDSAQITVPGLGGAIRLQRLDEHEFQGRHGPARGACASDRWFSSAETEQGWYLRWHNHFDFWVAPDGSVIEYCLHDDSTDSSVETYLLAQALSFALVAHGMEPLHGSAMSFRGKGIAVMGQPGAGKSTLSAALMAKGWKFLTDDLLVIRNAPLGGFDVMPGLPRIKLFPDQAPRMGFGALRRGVLNHQSPKLIIDVPHEQIGQRAPLRLLVELQRTTGDKPMLVESQGAAKMQLVYRNVFCPVIHAAERQQRLFKFLSSICTGLPIYRLTIPDDLSALPLVVEYLQDKIECLL